MKYKLIKEYPGSPILGHIIDLSETKGDRICGYKYIDEYWEVYKKDVTSYPEFWEEVKEKDYEILSWYFGDMNITKEPDGSAREYHIHSIKRLSDGEVFTMGDETNFGKIKSINLGTHKFYINYYGEKSATKLYRSGDEHKILIVFDKPGPISFEPQYLSNVKKARKFILTTEDGVDLYEGDVALRVLTKSSWPIEGITIYKEWWDRQPILTDWKYFSTKQAAEDYVLNKPVFSRKDLLDFLNSHKTREIHYNNVFIDISYEKWLKFVNNEDM